MADNEEIINTDVTKSPEKEKKPKKEKKKKPRKSVNALTKMFERKNSEKEKKSVSTAFDETGKESDRMPTSSAREGDSDDNEVKIRKKASSFVDRLQLFNKNAPQSTRLVQKDIEEKALPVQSYVKVLDENQNFKWVGGVEVEQMTSRKKTQDENTKESEKQNASPKKEPKAVQTEKNKKTEDDEENVDDLYDDLYCHDLSKYEKNQQTSKSGVVELVEDKSNLRKKSSHIDYKDLANESCNPETVINISNLSINQNNYNPIFNSLSSINDNKRAHDTISTNSKDTEHISTTKDSNPNWFLRHKLAMGLLVILITIVVIVLVKFL